MRLVAVGAHEQVPRPAEQRDRARLVAEANGIRAQLAAGQLDPLAGVGQQRDELVGRRRRARFVGSAEERDPRRLRRARRNRGEVALGRLHVRWRRVRLTRVMIRSATSFDRFSSAVCSAAIVANSDETTSMPASEPAVASTRIAPLDRSTSW